MQCGKRISKLNVATLLQGTDIKQSTGIQISTCAARVNFINVLRAVFMHIDPKSAINTDNLTVFFALSGSLYVKDAHRTLMKLTPSQDVCVCVCVNKVTTVKGYREYLLIFC